MSPSKKYNGNASSLASSTALRTRAKSTTTKAKAIKLQRKNTRVLLLPTPTPLASSKSLKSSSSSSSSPSSASVSASTASALLTSNIDTSSLFEEAQLLAPPRSTATAVAEIASLGSLKNNDNYETRNREKVSRTMPSLKIISYQNIFALLTVLVCGLAAVNGLKCYMCGQYNEGVGSITPCLNYSDQYAHLYLKECSKKSEKYCVKYVSELSTVRDCATECAEKEIWETQTYCCSEDGCNGSSTMEVSSMALMVPLVAYICNGIWNVIKGRR